VGFLRQQGNAATRANNSGVGEALGGGHFVKCGHMRLSQRDGGAWREDALFNAASCVYHGGVREASGEDVF
jgi:hypothetical protein